MANTEDLNRLTSCSLVLLGHIFLSLGNSRVRVTFTYFVFLYNECIDRTLEAAFNVLTNAGKHLMANHVHEPVTHKRFMV